RHVGPGRGVGVRLRGETRLERAALDVALGALGEAHAQPAAALLGDDRYRLVLPQLAQLHPRRLRAAPDDDAVVAREQLLLLSGGGLLVGGHAPLLVLDAASIGRRRALAVSRAAIASLSRGAA